MFGVIKKILLHLYQTNKETNFLILEIMNYQRFNRHAIFTSEDRTLVFNAIDEVEDRNDRATANMLFGLFDGYLYADLYKALDSQLRIKTLKQMTDLIWKIEDHILFKK